MFTILNLIFMPLFIFDQKPEVDIKYILIRFSINVWKENNNHKRLKIWLDIVFRIQKIWFANLLELKLCLSDRQLAIQSVSTVW